MIHVSRLSNRTDEFSPYERMHGNPITYRRVETLRKLRICMETGGGKKIQNLHSMAKKLSIGEWIYIYIRKKGFPRRFFSCINLKL